MIQQDMQLTDEHWSVVQPLIPKSKVRKDRKGRPRVESRRVLNEMLWILWTGAPWKALPSEYPPYQTCHRRMQEWVADRVFWKILKALAEELRDRGKTELTEAFINGTHTGAKRGALSSELLAVAPQYRSWQLQTVAVLRSPLGSPVVRAMKLSSSRKRLASASFRDRLLRLIGDKAYDSNVLDAELRKRGIDMNSPHTTKTQTGRKLRRYRKRWMIERVFAWLMRSRRLTVNRPV